MKCQSTFSCKNKKNIISLFLGDNLHEMSKPVFSGKKIRKISSVYP